MIILTSSPAAVNSADRYEVFPLALPTELDFIEADAREMGEEFFPTAEELAEAAELLNGDDFDVRTDAEWESMAEDSMNMDAVCSGHWAW